MNETEKSSKTEHSGPFVGKIRYKQVSFGNIIEQYHPDGEWHPVGKTHSKNGV